jgi:hypothetical protein
MAMEQIDTATASNRFVVPDGPRGLNVRISGITQPDHACRDQSAGGLLKSSEARCDVSQ